VSILLQGRSFYVIYVRKISTTPRTVIVAWCSLAFMVGFWSWYLVLGGSDTLRELFQTDELPYVDASMRLGLSPGAVSLCSWPVCGGRPAEPGSRQKKPRRPANAQQVTLHVKDMKQPPESLLNSTDRTRSRKPWRGFGGVESVAADEDDLENDRPSTFQFDPAKLNPGGAFCSRSASKGFVATIVEKVTAMRTFFPITP